MNFYSCSRFVVLLGALFLSKFNICYGQQPQSSPDEIKKIFISSNITAQQFMLSNGLTVTLIPNPKAPKSWVYHWVRVGSLHEKPGITGISHLFEHMMFRPLSPTAKPFDVQLKALGGTSNANTRDHATVYLSSAPHENLEKLLELESQRFQRLKVTDSLLDIERKAVWSEYSTKFDANPFIDLWFQIYSIAFPKHPYGWTIIGYRGDLEKIKAADCNQFFQKFYRPNNTGLFIAGDFDPIKIRKIIEKNYSTWKQGEDSKLPAAFVSENKFISGKGRLPSEAPNALIGIRIPQWTQANAMKFELGAFIFAHSRYSIFEKRLKDQLKIVSYAEPFNLEYDSGLMKFLFIPAAKTTQEQLITEFLASFKELKTMDQKEYASHILSFQTRLREGSLRNEDLIQNMVTSWGRFGSIEVYTNSLNQKIELPLSDLIAFYEPLFKKENLVYVSSPEKK